MKILLDENFPLALLRALAADGGNVDHIITLGLRGSSDQHIREKLLDKDVLFLTHDEDFLFGRSSEASERRFELMDDGSLLAWEEGPEHTWRAKRLSS